MTNPIYQHISDPTSITLTGGQTVDGKCIVATGSPIGRVLFKAWAPMIVVKGNFNSVTGCHLIGGTVGFHIGHIFIEGSAR
jgi:hypothetical protein